MDQDGPYVAPSCVHEALSLSDESVSLADLSSDGSPESSMSLGVSAPIRILERVLAEIAPTDIPVLLLGESGAGKEHIASEIHRLSKRHMQPFIRFNCSSMTVDSLPTAPARNGHSGAPLNGTLLLDEVSQLDYAKQSRLLNLLPDGGGSALGRCLTLRIISTNTKDLAEEIRNGNFREELYYRLNGICLRVPSLRQRKEDIPALFAFFLSKYATLFSRQQPRIKSTTMDLIEQHPWPGNVRELENMARKIVVLGDDALALSDLIASTTAATTPPGRTLSGGPPRSRSLKEAGREASRKAERELILKSLERTHWNRKRSARELQISYKALLYKLKQLNLDGSEDSET
jgi:two-component system, NtrC family, response regulator AtoC